MHLPISSHFKQRRREGIINGRQLQKLETEETDHVARQPSSQAPIKKLHTDQLQSSSCWHINCRREKRSMDNRRVK